MYKGQLIPRTYAYRAWDHKNKIMRQLEPGYIGKNGYFLTYNPGEYSDLIPSADIRDFTVMQYSGLNDRNDTRILEGDIVEHHQIIEEKGINNLLGTYVVIFEQGRFVFHDPKKPEVSGHYITPSSVVIVGNLYENPELVA